LRGATAGDDGGSRRQDGDRDSVVSSPRRRPSAVDDVSEILSFGLVVLVVSASLALAIAARAFSDRLRIPAAALLLVAAATASDIIPSLGDALSIADVQKISTIALIVILFEGGQSIGRRRFTEAAIPILSLGVLGTFATAGLIAITAHTLLGVSWTIAGLLGAALAPTDPAVTFSVLAGREIHGRSGTILEGESGFNDPVGIALMIAMVDIANSHGSLGGIGLELVLEMAVGSAVGALGGIALMRLIRLTHLPESGLYPLLVLACSGVVYGGATVLHGSGFLAVFIAGIVVGDAVLPHQVEIGRFFKTLGNLAEIGVFIALGLTINLAFIGDNGLWLDGLELAVLLGLVIRPLVVGLLLIPVDLRTGERLFVMWSGLKGAVPILLASLAVVGDTDYSAEIYGIVFVVVLFSVVVQGTSVPAVARAVGVPMRSASDDESSSNLECP
jgi:potassium/hydrogen antiporter